MKQWSSWALVFVLAALCGAVATLQYRWIGEISAAERARLREQLSSQLNSLKNAFSDEIRNSCAALQPPAADIDRQGREAAYYARYLQWMRAGKPLFSHVGLAVPRDAALEWETLDLETGRFSPAPWPADWQPLHDRLESRLQGRPVPPSGSPAGLIEIPRFGHRPGEHEQEWLLVSLNLDYIQTSLLPDLLDRYLGESGRRDFDVAVTSASAVIFQSGAAAPSFVADRPDASVTLVLGGSPGPRPSPGRGPGNGPPRHPEPHFGPHFESRLDPPPDPPGGRSPHPNLAGGPSWTLMVRHRAGSLEALVERARRRNLALSAGLLLLILATVAALVRFSRQAQRFAELQINFVAGVSHELRTPLTIIRTAAYNLRGRMAARPEQVERYGCLIQEESKKLDSLIEQVLRFAGAKAGHAIRRREPVQVDALIETVLQSSETAARQAGVVVETAIARDLPPVLGDELAMRHALQNLVDNALKYGAQGGNWMGVFASAVPDGVEIRVADRGPGVPADEQRHIFEPFFRGRRAVNDQIHGTGLGLDLVKKIVSAHGGTVQVNSAAGRQTEFVVRIPAA